MTNKLKKFSVSLTITVPTKFIGTVEAKNEKEAIVKMIIHWGEALEDFIFCEEKKETE